MMVPNPKGPPKRSPTPVTVISRLVLMNVTDLPVIFIKKSIRPSLGPAPKPQLMYKDIPYDMSTKPRMLKYVCPNKVFGYMMMRASWIKSMK